MSYILNALRKSEQERQALQPETATERILAQPPDRRRKTAAWVAVAILGNVLIIAGFIVYIQKKTSAPSIANQPSMASPVEKAGVMKPADKFLTKTIESRKSPANVSAPTLPALVEPVATNEPQEKKLKSPAGIAKKTVSVHVADTASRIKNPSLTKKEPPLIAARQPASAKLVPAPTEEKKPESEPNSTHKIPFLGELPYEFRQSVPKMKINVFVYSSDPSERFVMINMVKYKAGQQTTDAVELREIRPESLVVSYGDRIFQIGRP